MHTTPHTFSWRHFRCVIWLLWPCLSLAAQPLDINTATEADLDSLKGVGPATTARVLAERQKGAFANWADLMTRVKGIKAPAAAKLSAQGLTVNGTAYFLPSPDSQALPAAGAQ